MAALGDAPAGPALARRLRHRPTPMPLRVCGALGAPHGAAAFVRGRRSLLAQPRTDAGPQPCHVHAHSESPLLSEPNEPEQRFSTRSTAPTSQQQRRRPKRPSVSTPAQLTAAISACTSTAQLFALYRAHGSTFTHIHACAALHQLAEVAPAPFDADAQDPSAGEPTPSSMPLSPPQPAQRQDVGKQTVGKAKPLAVREAPAADKQPEQDRRSSNYAASTSASAASQPAARKATGAPGTRSKAIDASAQPPSVMQVSLMTAGLAAVLSSSCSHFDGRSVAMAASAMARLRYSDTLLLELLEQRSLELMRPLRERQEEDPQQQQQQQRRQRQQGVAEQAQAPSVSLDDLLAMLVAFGSLRHRPSRDWLAVVVAATEPHLALYAAPPEHRLPTLLASLGNTGYRPSVAWMQAACAAVLPHLPSLAAPQLRALIAGLSTMRHLPDDPWVAEYLRVSEAQLPYYTAGDLTTTMAALAALGCRPGDAWMARFYARAVEVVGIVGGLTGPQAASILASLTKLNCRPTGEWLNTVLLGTRRSIAEASSQQLTDLVCALSRLRFRPPEPWMQQFFNASFQRLPFYTPQQCCASAAALARLGRKPQRLWLDELGRQVGGRLALMGGGQQAEALAALVDLGYVPPAAWLAGYEQHSNAQLAACSAQQLCRVLGALAKTGFRPQVSWLYSFIMTAYSKLDAFDASQLALVFEALPALAPHGSWLDEIIQICAAEDAMRSQAAAQQQAAAAAEQRWTLAGPDAAAAAAAAAGAAGSRTQPAAGRFLRPGSFGALYGDAGAADAVELAAGAAAATAASAPAGAPRVHSMAVLQPLTEERTDRSTIPVTQDLLPAAGQLLPGANGGIGDANGTAAALPIAEVQLASLPMLMDGRPEAELALVRPPQLLRAPSAYAGAARRRGDSARTDERGGGDAGGPGGGGGSDGGGGTGGAGSGGGNGVERRLAIQEAARVPAAMVLAADASVGAAATQPAAWEALAATPAGVADGVSVAAAAAAPPPPQLVLQPRPRPLSAGPQAAAAAAAPASPSPIVTAASAAASAAAGAIAGIGNAEPTVDGRVQYLDMASLSRLIGAPDDPPGPDFSGCQKRAAEAQAKKLRNKGAFTRVGPLWSTDELGGPSPVPAPST